ncbi:hypothetical protein MPER_13926, partial [Moniliophthora perniciosa FA553]
EHFKAAEAYLAALERTQDDSTKRTLQMLYNEHHKAGSELEKKIERLKEEGKDPNAPQVQKPNGTFPTTEASHGLTGDSR